jgi:hypothetical protein
MKGQRREGGRIVERRTRGIGEADSRRAEKSTIKFVSTSYFLGVEITYTYQYTESFNFACVFDCTYMQYVCVY